MSKETVPEAPEIDPRLLVAEDDEFGEFALVAAGRPVAGVTDVEIPPRLAALLEVEVPKVLANSADKELVLTAKDKAGAHRLAAYAKAWGARQDRKLWIRKVPNTKAMADNIARLAVDYDDQVPLENRAGRRK